MITVAVIVMILAIGSVVISYFCIKGVYARNPRYIMPMVVLMGISAVLSFVDIFTAIFQSIVVAVIGIVLFTYQCFVLCSIYSKFQDEYNNRPHANVQATNADPERCFPNSGVKSNEGETSRRSKF